MKLPCPKFLKRPAPPVEVGRQAGPGETHAVKLTAAQEWGMQMHPDELHVVLASENGTPIMQFVEIEDEHGAGIGGFDRIEKDGLTHIVIPLRSLAEAYLQDLRTANHRRREIEGDCRELLEFLEDEPWVEAGEGRRPDLGVGQPFPRRDREGVLRRRRAKAVG